MYIYGNDGIESDLTYSYKEGVEHEGRFTISLISLKFNTTSFQGFIHALTIKLTKSPPQKATID